MNCEQTHTLLEEFFDGELEPASAARLAAHLAGCPACAAAHEGLAREQEFYLRAEPALTLAPDFWSGVTQRANTDAHAPPKTAAGAHAKANTGRADTNARPRADADARADADRAPRRAARLWTGLSGRLITGLAAPRFSPALTAAAVILAVGLTAVVMKYLNTRHTPAPATVARVEETPTQEKETAAGTANNEADNRQGPPLRDERAESGAGTHAESNAGTQPVAGQDAAHETVEPKRVVASAAGTTRTRPRATDAARREPTADELVREAEHKYVAAIALLSRDVRRRRPALDAAQAARFEQTLATVDRAIDEARRAARRRPDDPQAAQFMLAAYARKVDVLRELANQ